MQSTIHVTKAGNSELSVGTAMFVTLRHLTNLQRPGDKKPGVKIV